MKDDDKIVGMIYESMNGIWTELDSQELYENMMNESAGDEIRIQLNVLRDLSEGDEKIVKILIDMYGAVFRSIINKFKEHNSLPTEDELINMSNEYTGKDIRNIINQLKQHAA